MPWAAVGGGGIFSVVRCVVVPAGGWEVDVMLEGMELRVVAVGGAVLGG